MSGEKNLENIESDQLFNKSVAGILYESKKETEAELKITDSSEESPFLQGMFIDPNEIEDEREKEEVEKISKRIKYIKHSYDSESSDEETEEKTKEIDLNEIHKYFTSEHEMREQIGQLIEHDAAKISPDYQSVNMEKLVNKGRIVVKQRLINNMIRSISDRTTKILTKMIKISSNPLEIERKENIYKKSIMEIIKNGLVKIKPKTQNNLLRELSKMIVNDTSSLSEVERMSNISELPPIIKKWVEEAINEKIIKTTDIIDINIVTEDEVEPNVDLMKNTIVFKQRRMIDTKKKLIVQTKHQISELANQEPSWIKEIKKRANTVVLDIDNMKKAMHLTEEQIVAFAKYVNLYGITTVQCSYDLASRMKGINITIAVDEDEHDDTLMIMLSYVNDAVIVTNDEHKEFAMSYSMCLKHNNIMIRENDFCPMAGIDNCKIVNLGLKSIGKMTIKNIVNEGERIKQIELSNPIIREKTHKYSTNVKQTMKHKCPVPLFDTRVIMEKIMQNNDFNDVGVIKVQTTPILKKPVTSLHISLSTGTRSVVGEKIIAGVIQSVEDMDESEIKELDKLVEYMLVKKDGKIAMIDISTGRKLARKTNVPYILTQNMRKITEVVLQNEKSISLRSNYSMKNIYDEIRLGKGIIDMKDSILHFNTKMIDSKMVVMENKTRIYVIKIDQQIADSIDKELLDAAINDEKYSTNIINAIGLSTSAKVSIGNLFLSGDSYDETTYHDVASRVLPTNSALMKIMSRMDPDKPSYSLIANPEECNWTLATTGMEIVSKKIGKCRIKENINANYKYHEIIPSANASFLYAQWENHCGEEVPSVSISSVVWSSREIKAINITKQEVEVMINVLPDIISWKINRITRNIIEIFKDMVQGVVGMSLPNLMIGIKLPHLEIDNKETEVNEKFCAIITWNLPTCSVISKLYIESDTTKNFMVSLVSVSPPITHNYIAAKLGMETSTTNEYNTVMCERIEMESMMMFEVLMDKLEHLNMYLTYYGVYAEGLKMLGIDPLEMIIKQISVIEHGTKIEENLDLLSTRINVSREVNMSSYIHGVMTNNKEIVLLKRTYKKGGINVSKEIHDLINMLITLKSITFDQYKIGMQHASYLLGSTNIINHIRLCYKITVSNNLLDVSVYNKLRNKNTVKVIVCLNELIVPFQLTQDEAAISEKSIEIMSSDNIPMYIEGGNVISEIPRMKTVNVRNIKKGIPIAGRVVLIKIMPKSKINKMYRVKDISEIMKTKKMLDIEYVNITENDVVECIKSIQEIIKKAELNNKNVIIVNYDKFPSLIKKTEWFQNGNLDVSINTVIYIPDTLMFNVLQRKFKIKDAKQTEIERIKVNESEIEEEIKETLTKGNEEEKIDIFLSIMCLVITILIAISKLIMVKLALATVLFLIRENKETIKKYIIKIIRRTYE